MKKPICIYHANCADGFTAAWVLHTKFGDQIDFHPGIYGQEPPDVSGRDVVMVDFSYKRQMLNAMGERANSILILDHHKTAQDDLAGIPGIPAGSQWLDTKWDAGFPSGIMRMATLFDMDRSGAQIAWDFFYPRSERPLLVDYVGDRDLWRFKLPLSREVNAFVFAHEYTFMNWDYLHAQLSDHMGVQRVADMGGAIEKKHHKDVAELVAVTRRTMRIGGITMPVANIPHTLTSDAGHLMARQDQGVAACYWDTPTGRVFSLRSTDAGPDVSEIARHYGGGGHRAASGFKMTIGWEGD